jgi:hypothetical protein
MTDDARRRILSKVRGQRVLMAYISALHLGWALPSNPHASLIRGVVDEVLATHAVSSIVHAKLTRGRLDVMTSRLYPNASAETLQELAYGICWMFLVDDEINQCSSAARNSKVEFDALTTEPMRFAALTMGLGENGEVIEDEQLVPAEKIGRSAIEAAEPFRRFVLKMRSVGVGKFRQLYVCRFCVRHPCMENFKTECHKAQRRRFYWALKETFDEYVVEQAYRLAHEVHPFSVYGATAIVQAASISSLSCLSKLSYLLSSRLFVLHKLTT